MSDGFKINALSFRDADTGELLWNADSWPDNLSEEVPVHIPARILKCKAVAREVKFSSQDSLENLQMVQLVFMEHPGTQELVPIEDWKFHFGFVIPNSHNSWQSVTVAAGEGNMVDPVMASGKVIIITRFTDDDQVVSEMRVRVFYD